MAKQRDDKKKGGERPRLPTGPGSGAGGVWGRSLLWIIFGLLIMFWLWGQYAAPTASQISYTSFRQQVEQNGGCRHQAANEAASRVVVPAEQHEKGKEQQHR